ncbi:MAG: phosphoglycerate kinase [bacterium]|nr:phosphoglycerate kinase [bacterium]
MFYSLLDIRKVDVKGKTVFLRADLDVPLSEGGDQISDIRKIDDDTRLVSVLPTVQYLLNNGGTVIIAGHLDRPKGLDKSLSLKPVAEWLQKESGIRNQESGIEKKGDFNGWKITDNLFLLENLRFYEGEETNDEEFSKKLADLAGIYVNDAFAMCHRSHASIVGITHFLPHFAGIHLQQEVENLGHVLENPKKPLVIIIGGKKIETKLPLIEKMMQIADFVLVGGKISQEAQATSLATKVNGKAQLIVAASNKDATDVTKDSLLKFLDIIKNAKTVIWNGPIGVINLKLKDTEESTIELAKGIVASGAYSVVGGGDTTEFLKRIGMEGKFNFVSTGGGAMLSFLAGESLPGLEALIK